ncbi:thioredoxin family protein [Pseudothermotoga thermarum]|uniref:Thioredoxin domain-containing protein n=1 Tax=Pseudothermotoga thermarum DSM 5069 TaxID=688269 RepID=F7YVN5_9THEM|nr:thioredoxin fold domain-containing protein [Pseudothermotoga thermarum]AEH51700.1 hypothetical protein Theth_1652 [Pseudothermotoga thermarum DSM 5069]
MKKVFGVIFVVLSVITFSKTILFDDVDVAANLARIEQKKLAIVFTTATCPYCVKLKNETLKDKTVEQLIKANFVFVEVMYDSSRKTTVFGRQMSYSELFSYFSVRGVPTTWFLDQNAKPIVSLPGYAPAATFAQVLRYVYQEIKEDFQSYSRKKDDFVGEVKLIEVSEEEAQYVLKHDPNAVFVESMPSEVDIFKVHVTKDEVLAKKLSETGVFRVLLAK